MAKKNPGMTPEEQIEKFHETVRALIDAGELNPIEADERMERLMTQVKPSAPSREHSRETLPKLL